MSQEPSPKKMIAMNPIIRWFLFAVVGYGLLILLVFLMQRRMIYAPETSRPTDSEAQTMGLHCWPNAADDFRGFVSADPSGHYRGTVVAFHGNAGSAWQREYFLHALEPLGYRVILAISGIFGQNDPDMADGPEKPMNPTLSRTP